MSPEAPTSPERARMLDHLRTRAAALGPAGIRARFRAAAAEFEAMLAEVPEAEARRPPRAGGWSIAQVADHLAQSMIRSADELRQLLAGRRPPAPPVYDGLVSGAAGWAPWAELLGGVRSADAEFDALLEAAVESDPPAAAAVRAILVVNRADGEPDVFAVELPWKEYVLVQRLHLLDHRSQVRTLRAAPR